MMNLCIVIEVIQKKAPATNMVIIPGTHPKTLYICQNLIISNLVRERTHDNDQV